MIVTDNQMTAIYRPAFYQHRLSQIATMFFNRVLLFFSFYTHLQLRFFFSKDFYRSFPFIPFFNLFFKRLLSLFFSLYRSLCYFFFQRFLSLFFFYTYHQHHYYYFFFILLSSTGFFFMTFIVLLPLYLSPTMFFFLLFLSIFSLCTYLQMCYFLQKTFVVLLFLYLSLTAFFFQRTVFVLFPSYLSLTFLSHNS